MIKLKPMTNKSWMVLSEINMDKIGVLSESRNKIVLMTTDSRSEFNSRDEVNEFFHKDVFSDTVEDLSVEESKKVFVKGFPVPEYEVFYPKDNSFKSDLPVYTKSESSNVLYSAGYYAIDFGSGYKKAFCPKLETLDKYTYIGPFKTSFDVGPAINAERLRFLNDQQTQEHSSTTEV